MRKTKIGILTFHRALNYGAVLQCYALKEQLANMGNDVEIIDYRPQYIEKYREFFYWKDIKQLSIMNGLRYLLRLPVDFYFRRKAARSFDKFLEDNFRFSTQVFSYQEMPKGFDIIIFGSDQIWSPEICEGFDLVYWGQFRKGRTRFVTYAASLGGHNSLSDFEWGYVKKYIEVFDRLSVREKQLHESLSRLSPKAVELVIDPTLLVDESVFHKISIRPTEKDFVLLFTLEESDKAYSFAKRIAEEKGLKIIRLSLTPPIINKEKEAINVSCISPAEFCGYFKFATYVVTISFHGTAFSIIFRRNFYTLRSRMQDRALHLLKLVGLEKRLVSPEDVKAINQVDYSQINEKLKLIRSTSCNYLTTSIN